MGDLCSIMEPNLCLVFINVNLTITNRRNVSNYPETSITKSPNSFWESLEKEIPQKCLRSSEDVNT